MVYGMKEHETDSGLIRVHVYIYTCTYEWIDTQRRECVCRRVCISLTNYWRLYDDFIRVWILPRNEDY